MNAALLLPAALGALAALLVPIAIHVARRTEGRTVEFAALRWLEARPAPRRRLRITERRLLAARLVLLTLTALWLARPVLWGVDDKRRVVAAAPGLDARALLAGADKDIRLVWLAPGFPPLEQATPSVAGNVVSLIRQLDAELPPEAGLELVVPPVLEGVDAERPRLTRRVAWRIAPMSRPSAPSQPRPPPRLTIRYSADAEDGVRYFRAAAAAWSPPGASPAFEAARVERAFDSNTRHLVWLAAGAVPDRVAAWIKGGGTALLARDARLNLEGETSTAWRDPLGEPLVVEGRLGEGRVLRLTRALEPAAIPQLLEPDFPDALARMLAPPPSPARVAASDHAPLVGARPYAQPPKELRPWLALLIAAIFGLERWLATRKRRAVAP